MPKKKKKHSPKTSVKEPWKIHDVAKFGSLGEYFDALNYFIKTEDEYWFRGHADISWKLVPSALRFPTLAERNRALNLISDFKRFAEIKIPHPPSQKDELKWVQSARHYGLPTRLLDWTKNAAIALYCACYELEHINKDGAVFFLNPVSLNTETDKNNKKVLDPNSDAKIIDKYLQLKGSTKKNGSGPIAIYPIWNSDRIVLQQGTFTIAGSREFALNNIQAPGLCALRIKKEHKTSLLTELDRIGINEMTIFPEPEHICKYLIWKQTL